MLKEVSTTCFLVSRKAIELARREYPAAVVEVEEEYGDWLMSQKAMDAAINHFIEVRCFVPPCCLGLLDVLGVTRL